MAIGKFNLVQDTSRPDGEEGLYPETEDLVLINPVMAVLRGTRARFGDPDSPEEDIDGLIDKLPDFGARLTGMPRGSSMTGSPELGGSL